MAVDNLSFNMKDGKMIEQRITMNLIKDPKEEYEKNLIKSVLVV